MLSYLSSAPLKTLQNGPPVECLEHKCVAAWPGKDKLRQ
jgi:hypothetical protein